MGGSQIENMLVRYAHEEEYDFIGMSGVDISAVWDVNDTYVYELYDKCIALQNIDRELSIQSSLYFDEQLLRRYEDKRSGTDIKMQPLQIAVKPNKILKDGLTRFNSIMANKSSAFFNFYASGTGTSPVSIGNKGLDDENARVDMRRDGILDATGNVLFMRARFPSGIADADISEFGACDQAEDPSTFAWRVVLSDPLEHIQNERFYNSSHYLVTYSK